MGLFEDPKENNVADDKTSHTTGVIGGVSACFCISNDQKQFFWMCFRSFRPIGSLWLQMESTSMSLRNKKRR